jgi:DNA-binding NarL/FixJ family response regulator
MEIQDGATLTRRDGHWRASGPVVPDARLAETFQARVGRLSDELEIATFAAKGIASRTIAERLVVSVRIVDNHLYSAYVKLGVTCRAELGRILRLP